MNDDKQKRLDELEKLCSDVGHLLAGAMEPKQAGFCLVVFDFGESGWLTYMSNAKRTDVRNMLAEFEQVLAEGKDKPPGADHSGEPAVNPS